jgi:2-amino-4-hydroxy-6-hydroxymethyldihydropteridine diphosphokinase
MNRLRVFSAEPLLRSSMWRTDPVDCPPGSAGFLNAVVAWKRGPEQTPERLLEMFQSLEREFGRPPKMAQNEPRTLDLDLIVCGAETRNQERLTLPHPRAIRRAFVLYPMAEILPDLILPGQGRTVRELRDALGEDGRLMVSRVKS